MTGWLAARLKKLEGARSKPKVRHTFAEFDPVTGCNVGMRITSRRVMRIPVWPSNEAWESTLVKQQARLTAEAASK